MEDENIVSIVNDKEENDINNINTMNTIINDMNNNNNNKISKEEWKKKLIESRSESKVLNIIDNTKKLFNEALFICDEMFVNDLHKLIDMAKEISCNKGETSWDLKILWTLGNDTTIAKNNYEIKGYSCTLSDGRKRFFSTDVFVYGLHPKNNTSWMNRHFQPWIENGRTPGFWRVKMELENDPVFPCWLIDNSNPDKSKWSHFKIFFDDIITRNITIKKNNKSIHVKVYGQKVYWHGGNTIGSTFQELTTI